ncbi:unnamed protein product [Calicophoron daubneyi]|uniref:Vinculin n=1 Tax=Calicophoron daubneyi TaxID=300641 RepID=A0AAV2T434_CALDB
MSDFVDRVSHYPVVEGTCKVANDAYQWIKARDGLNPILTKVEEAATSLASVVRPVVNNSVTQKLDDVACSQVLDRVEKLCPTLKEASGEQILGMVADTALDLAETCAKYCLPEESLVPAHASKPTRQERLSCLQKRATNQAVRMFHASVDRAFGLLVTLERTEHTIANAAASRKALSVLNQAKSTLEFALDTAKAVGIPLIIQGLSTSTEQLGKLDKQLKESGKLSGEGLQRVITGLERLRSFLRDQMKQSEENQPTLEMQEVSRNRSEVN